MILSSLITLDYLFPPSGTMGNNGNNRNRGRGAAHVFGRQVGGKVHVVPALFPCWGTNKCFCVAGLAP